MARNDPRPSLRHRRSAARGVSPVVIEPLLGDWRYINGASGPIEVWDGQKWQQDSDMAYSIQRPRVLAQAIVDLLRNGSVPLFEVTATGLAPYDRRRTYCIEAASDTLAAEEGIRRFVEEMEALGPAS